MFIFKTLLDLDLYKLTMAQFAWLKHPDVTVRYGFTNRTRQVPLANIVGEDELRYELEHVRSLHFHPNELEFLQRCRHLPPGMFRPEFLDFLRTLRLPPMEIERTDDDQYRIETEGRWPEAIFWETIILGIVNHLYFRALAKEDRDAVYLEGCDRLARKIEVLRANPKIRFVEFGTRRRYLGNWQSYVVGEILEHVPEQLAGTSNVELARKYGLPPVGTMAHETFMVMSGIARAEEDSDEHLRVSHGRTLNEWREVYGDALSIALTDTYGSEFFFQDFGPERASAWRGLRQDSGDPFEFGERAIKFYQSVGVDPREKTIVWSDGLDVETIVRLHEQFHGRVKDSYGWGTNLTNDLGFNPLSLVVKATRAAGFPTVKLSDNLAKAMGPAEEVERFKRVFGYTGTTSAECRY